MKSLKSIIAVQPLSALAVGAITVWLAGCGLFQSHQASPPRETRPMPRVSTVTRLRPSAVHSAPAVVSRPSQPPAPIIASKPSQPHLNLPPQLPPAPLVTLGNSEDAKTSAQRLIDQTSARMTHINRAELAESTVSTYEQANELINAAQHAMATQDYPAASSLAEKASALTNQLPSQGEKP